MDDSMETLRKTVARAVHEALCKVDVGAYLDMPSNTAEVVADAAIAAMPDLASHAADAWQAGVKAGLEAAAMVCEQQRADFLSPAFAFPQPVGSLSERFACTECIDAIRAIDAASVLPSPSSARPKHLDGA